MGTSAVRQRGTSGFVDRRRHSSHFPSGDTRGIFAGTLVSRSSAGEPIVIFHAAWTPPMLANAIDRESGNHDGDALGPIAFAASALGGALIGWPLRVICWRFSP